MNKGSLAFFTLFLAGCAHTGSDSDFYSTLQMCKEKHFNSAVDAAKCRNEATKYSWLYRDPQTRDLAELMNSTRLSLAEKEDRGEISNAEARVRFSQMNAYVKNKLYQLSSKDKEADPD